MKITNGRLDTALWVPSPNFGPRPDTESGAGTETEASDSDS